MSRKKKNNPNSGKRLILATYSVEEIMLLKNLDHRSAVLNVDGADYKVPLNNIMFRTLVHSGTECKACGLVGSFFRLERMSHAPEGTAYFNLYGYKNGTPVLFTRDHIIPRSKGGTNILSNMQTMCNDCNGKKGNTAGFKFELKVQLGNEQYVKKFREYGPNVQRATMKAKSLMFDAGITNDVRWTLHYCDNKTGVWKCVTGN